MDVRIFEKGVYIGEDYTTKPSKLEVLNPFEFEDGSLGSEVHVTISEGKFHQVKRMFEAVGKEVVYLQRIQMGGLELDEELDLGEYRELTPEEVELLEIRDI